MAPPSKARFVVPTLIGLVLILPIAVLVLFSAGFTSGEEFSPDDFTRRNFYYNRLPIFKWTIVGKQYSDVTSDLEKSLVSDGFIIPAASPAVTWHLCRDSGTDPEGRMSNDCDARFLVEYLLLPGDETNSYWEEWNENHPELAKIFWPSVADLARRKMYLAMPDVMRLAMALDDGQIKTRKVTGKKKMKKGAKDDIEAFSRQLKTTVEEVEARFKKR